MDDTGPLRFATDCALTDSRLSDIDDGLSADVCLPAAFESPPSLEQGESRALEANVSEAADEDMGVRAGVMASEGGGSPEAAGVARLIEALLFSSDAPLSAARLAEVVGSCTPAVVRKHVDALNLKYERVGLSFRIEAIARGYQMMTLPGFGPWIAELNRQRSETRLSAAALETLSIIAYKQPIIRADVEAIRGVACSEVISRLREIGLIRVIGRAEVVGRPLLYGTTKKFLHVFGLADLDDLPPLAALRLKSRSKPVEEIQPVEPPPELAMPCEPCAVAGT
jgi:segregation and condensation protein B